MFKFKGPIVYIVITIIVLAICLGLYLATGSTEWSGHWEFTF